jgi:hypothetical protein
MCNIFLLASSSRMLPTPVTPLQSINLARWLLMARPVPMHMQDQAVLTLCS